MKIDSEETPPPESNDPEFGEDVLKQEADQVDVENVEVKVGKLNHVNPEMVSKLSEALKDDWEKLAQKLGYTSSEVINHN